MMGKPYRLDLSSAVKPLPHFETAFGYACDIALAWLNHSGLHIWSIERKSLLMSCIDVQRQCRAGALLGVLKVLLAALTTICCAMLA